jgi:hypothetical protein
MNRAGRVNPADHEHFPRPVAVRGLTARPTNKAWRGTPAVPSSMPGNPSAPLQSLEEDDVLVLNIQFTSPA